MKDFHDDHQFSRAQTPGRSLVENLKPISRRLDCKDDSSAPKNDLTRHFKDFMSSNSINLKRVRSFSQPKETKEIQMTVSNNTICKCSDKYKPSLYSSKDKFSGRKMNSNLTPKEDVMRDRNNNNSLTCESGREKIIYKKSKTSPLLSNVNSNIIYPISDGNKPYLIDTKFSSSIDDCLSYEVSKQHHTLNTSHFSRDSWHRIHNKFNHRKVLYPVQCETFL